MDWCKDAEGRTGQGPDAHDWSEVRAAGRWDLNLGARGGWGGKGLPRYLGTWPCRGGVRSGPTGRGGGEVRGWGRECGQQQDERATTRGRLRSGPGGCRFRPGCAVRFCFLREGACGLLIAPRRRRDHLLQTRGLHSPVLVLLWSIHFWLALCLWFLASCFFPSWRWWWWSTSSPPRPVLCGQ